MQKISYDLKSTNIFDKEWEVLLVLDACRVDALQQVADEYEFLPENIPSIVSVGAGSPRWLANTFSKDNWTAMESSVYVSANPHTRRVLRAGDDGFHAEYSHKSNDLTHFGDFMPIWEFAWDDSTGTVPPRPVTDHIINQARNSEKDHIIGHYMQPHFPSIPDRLGTGMNIEDEARWENNIWERLERGDLPVARAWESYLENLRYVLDDVQLILNNIDAETVVITADHGNAFGEGGKWGHGDEHLSETREVPLVMCTARDSGDYTVKSTTNTETEATTDVDSKLEALGYKM